jgi:hypothetical protein
LGLRELVLERVVMGCDKGELDEEILEECGIGITEGYKGTREGVGSTGCEWWSAKEPNGEEVIRGSIGLSVEGKSDADGEDGSGINAALIGVEI